MFESKFITQKNAMKLIVGLRFKLQMFGVPIKGTMDFFCYNKAVFKNITNPDSVLNKN